MPKLISITEVEFNTQIIPLSTLQLLASKNLAGVSERYEEENVEEYRKRLEIQLLAYVSDYVKAETYWGLGYDLAELGLSILQPVSLTEDEQTEFVEGVRAFSPTN